MYYVCFFFNDPSTPQSYTTVTLFPCTTLFRSSVGRIGDRRPTDDRALGDAGQSGRRPHRIDRILEALLQPRVGIALDPLGLPELIIGIPLPTRPEIPLQPEERVPDRIFGAVGVRSDLDRKSVV